MEEKYKYLNALNVIGKLGPVRWKRLLNYFSDPEHIWQGTYSEFKEAGIEEKVIEHILTRRKQISPDSEWERLTRLQIGMITQDDKTYPTPLKEIYRSPVILYFRGDLSKLNTEQSLAVVGTRTPTSYGREITNTLVRDLARGRLTIVSGLALGIDCLAHQATVESSGITIAVLGNGLDTIYPRSNQAVADKILSHGGAILSEYPIGVRPMKGNFPMRNRIIAGITRGTLVTEAGLSSGALITAKYALEFNREVFAVPGSIITKNAQGPNSLIQMGAKLVSHADDILSELNIEQTENIREIEQALPLSPEEEKLISVLDNEPLHVDRLIQRSNQGTAQVTALLTILEMKGRVKNIGGATYLKL